MKKKIMITTFQNAYNYGAILQNYALEKKLIELGYEVQTLNYLNKEIERQYKPIYFSNPKDGIKRLLKRLCYSIPKYGIRKQRVNSFSKFITENIHLTKGYSKQEIKQLNLKDDILITGSDQVWNPEITRGLDDIYTLNFGNNIKKISYAASIGNVKHIEMNQEAYKQIINRLNAISVREEETQEILTKIAQKEITTVLDPTLLLTAQEWNEKIKDLKPESQKYICAYVVEPNEEYMKIVNMLSEKTGLPVVHFEVKNPGYKNVLKSAYTEGPLEFIHYIQQAEYVVTTSFHATIFSVLFQKKFWVIPHKGTGTRVTNLLNNIGAKERIVYSCEEFKTVDYEKQIEWTDIKKKLEEKRQKSIIWLKETIEK